jgi:hypothetical protein
MLTTETALEEDGLTIRTMIRTTIQNLTHHDLLLRWACIVRQW